MVVIFFITVAKNSIAFVNNSAENVRRYYLLLYILVVYKVSLYCPSSARFSCGLVEWIVPGAGGRYASVRVVVPNSNTI